MRVGLTVSIVGHLALLGLGFVAFPEMRPFQAQEIDALPVDLVPVSELTDLLPGSKTSEKKPEEKPQPKPEAKAEVEKPKPVEAPPEKPVETAAAPPVPEPAPEPKPDLIAQPEEAKPEPAPAPTLEPATTRVVSNPRVPRERPKPPRPVAKTEPQQEDFNADEIAALLNKAKPSGGAETPSNEPQTIGSIDGKPEAKMTQSELAALKARLYQCWSPPVAVREAGALVVEVRINLLPDGSLAGAPELIRVEQAGNPLSRVAAEAAVRAVALCAPFGDILRPENYAIWKAIDFVFDPREMLGG